MKINRSVWMVAGWSVLAAASYGKEIVLDVIAPTQEREAIVWNVDREITGFRIEVVEGRPIINKVKIVRGEEWGVGAYFSPGQPLEKKFDAPRSAGQIGANLDNARQTKLRLVIFTR